MVRCLRRSGQCRDQFFLANELNIRPAPYRPLQCHLKIDDLDLVLDERPAGFAVLAAPLHIPKLHAIAVAKQTRPSIGKRIDVMGRSGGEAVELRTRTVEVAGMEEALQAVVG